MSDIPISPLIALGALVYTFVNFLKYLQNKHYGSATTQLVSWVSGVLAVELVAHTSFAAGITVGGVPLDTMSGASLLVVGLLVTSLISTVNQGLFKSIDNSSTSYTPPLFPKLASSGSSKPPSQPPAAKSSSYTPPS